MSFNINSHGGYGQGSLGDIEISEGMVENLNSYARITSANENIITINSDTAVIGAFEDFSVGTEILIHVSASPNETKHLGKYLFAKILSVNGNEITLDKNFSEVFSQLNYYYVQAITVAQINRLTLLNKAILKPPPYNPFKFHGGVLALKVRNELTFKGGNIDLTDCGIPTNRKESLRPLTEQEVQGEKDASFEAGRENFITKENFLLNAGDGAAIIFARKINFQEDTRIGNPKTHGARLCRGATDSIGLKPGNVTNIGGSTIFICAKEIKNFSHKIIAKYRSANLTAGQGLARCYIASETELNYDEGLYSYDRIKTPDRIKINNITDLGDGRHGEIKNPKFSMNNYAKIKFIGKYQAVYSRKTNAGLAAIQKNARVIVRNITGEFYLANVLEDDGEVLTLDYPAPSNFKEGEIISIAQLKNFTLTKEYTPPYGKILAITVNETCRLEDGKIFLPSNEKIGSAQSATKISTGTIFILANKIIANENTRLGENVFLMANTYENFSASTVGKNLNPNATFQNPERGCAFILSGEDFALPVGDTTPTNPERNCCCCC